MDFKQRNQASFARRQIREDGFTLLELLMVVTILSSTAMLAMMTMETQTSQHRIIDTENRLKLLKNATVKTVYINQSPVDTGYVVDNGRLPPCVAGLLTATDCDVSTGGTSSMLTYGFQAPVFDPTPDATSRFNNNSGDETEFLESDERLWKGFRSVYLNSVITDDFRDSWRGTGDLDSSSSHACPGIANSNFDDERNYGWCRKLDSNRLTYIGLGRDGLTNYEADYDGDGVSPDANSDGVDDEDLIEPQQDKDMEISVEPSEWRRDSSATFLVNLTNNSGSDIEVSNTSTGYALVLLEFVNGEDRGFWRQTELAADTSLSSNTVVVSGNSIVLTATLASGLAIGEHLLFLAAKDSGGLRRVDDDYPRQNGSTDRLTHKFTVYSGIGIKDGSCGADICWEIN
ncbi:type II secretion system protein [Thiomicrorhabdus heinhorstiae]|uniref:Prepilin-type N-terminal cleavage/methylation domain-containing protein n=1 Tax=Thiomicrorhabdus heinhorstiae TaxID=2748010 RepID=A0ABS0BU74_9GAMM|nr:prepilin-type N-terminal cleavage/methylation domain-containing protein [Thiomicrorhabdus heinhorstiae]MBF6057386.1 prepilin-type N-terminal cleavage/methylation domain-containing protein [Thiomicrorhabdus heinhorstiae]